MAHDLAGEVPNHEKDTIRFVVAPHAAVLFRGKLNGFELCLARVGGAAIASEILRVAEGRKSKEGGLGCGGCLGHRGGSREDLGYG